jgi:ferredoxin
MPNPKDKVPDNVPGPYYNDLSCIDCGMCPEIAPLIFKRQEDTGYSYVHHQPSTPGEIAQAELARESCPTESIGNDGVSSLDESGCVDLR